jgi:hypothetical protein
VCLSPAQLPPAVLRWPVRTMFVQDSEVRCQKTQAGREEVAVGVPRWAAEGHVARCPSSFGEANVAVAVLDVSASGYYGWVARSQQQPRGRAAEDLELLAQIRRPHGRFAYYGAPRIHRVLLVNGLLVGRHRVARRGPIKARRRSAPPSRRPEAVDRVRRRFTASAPNRLWFTEPTHWPSGPAVPSRPSSGGGVGGTDRTCVHGAASGGPPDQRLIAHRSSDMDDPLCFSGRNAFTNLTTM